ncbi:MAG: hypothetical protein ACK5NT_09120 [Pyrinomonadaceae bacterium]
MRKKVAFIFGVLVITISCSFTSFAQFGDLVNKARNEIEKKVNKKKTKETNAGKTPGNDSSRDSNSSGSYSKKADEIAPPQNELGTIYLSNTPFPTDGSIAGAKTSFNSSENIYGRLVLKNGTIRNVIQPDPPSDEVSGNNFRFTITQIDRDSLSPGVRPVGRIFRAIVNESDLDKSYWDFDVLPPVNNAKTLYYWGGNPLDGFIFGNSLYMFMTNDTTKEGKYEMYVEIKPSTKDFRGNPEPESNLKSIEAKFEFSFNGRDYAQVKANYDTLNKNFEAAYNQGALESREAPPEWKAASNRLISGVTPARLNSAFLGLYTNRAQLSVLKVYANKATSSSLWSVQKNSIGIPLYRYSNQWYMGFGKNRVTGNCFYHEFGLRQNYTGGGTYSAIFGDINKDRPTPIQCSKLGIK